MKSTAHDMENSATVIRFAVILAQCFGMFPVHGVFSDRNVSGWKFKWNCWITYYSLFYLFCTVMNVVFQICKMAIGNHVALTDFVAFLFFLWTVFTILVFFDLARKWKELMKKWVEADHLMSLSFEYPPKLKRTLIIITSVVLFFAACEHGLFLLFIQNTMKKDERGIIPEEEYFFNRYDHVFRFLPYNTFFGIITQIVNVFSTFSWNYMDLFIMLISKMIGIRFQQIRKRIQKLSKMEIAKDARIWYLLRQDYIRVKGLCRHIDRVMSNIIFLSFSNNLFVVLIQLFNSIKRKAVDNMIDKIYFTYSFAFLIIRTIAVALYGSIPHNESITIGRILHNLSNDVYNEEVRRLLLDVKTDPPMLSGHKIFVLTKPLILHIAATIVTYELIIIQFNP